MLHPRQDVASIQATAVAVQPFAVLLTCSDSRVIPEIIFDQGIGDLFTVRVAGNVANGDEIASVEYAIEQFHVPLCLVMGHSGCRAVQAMLSGNSFPLDQDQLFRQIRIAAEQVRRERPTLFGVELAEAVVRSNVARSMEELAKRVDTRHAQKAQIVGAEYLSSGEVLWLDSQS